MQRANLAAMNKTIAQLLDDDRDWFNWINGMWVSMTVLRFLYESKLLEQLGEAPVSFESLSAAMGIPVDKLERLAAYFAAQGVLDMPGDGTVAHNRHSRRLLEEMDTVGVCLHALGAGTPMHEALRQGRTPHQLRYGKPVFEYLAGDPETAKNFAGLMSLLTSLANRFVFSQHRFESFELAVDVGGNHGELLFALLQYYPQARGVLFDLPEVTHKVAESVRKSEYGGRIEIVGGDFFASVPAADLYLLKMILHDWSDEECVRILGSIRAAIRPQGRLAVIETLLPETPCPHPANNLDIAMMVWGTGHERKRSGFEALFAKSGFRLDRITENPDGPSVIEAVPV